MYGLLYKISRMEKLMEQKVELRLPGSGEKGKWRTA